MKLTVIFGIFAILTAALFGCRAIGNVAIPNNDKYIEMNTLIPDLMKIDYIEKADTVKIAGKVAIAISSADNDPGYLDRFSPNGAFISSSGLLPADMYAKNADELGTLFTVKCKSKMDTEQYKGEIDPRRNITFETLTCKGKLFDYKQKKLIAEMTVVSGGKASTLYLKPNESVVSAEFPSDMIRDFLAQIPSVSNPAIMAQPSGEHVEIKDLVADIGKVNKAAEKYENKVITTTGFITAHHFAGRYDFVFLNINQDTSGNQIACYMSTEKGSLPAFNSLKEGINRVTVTGIYVNEYGLGNIQNCRLVSAEPI